MSPKIHIVTTFFFLSETGSPEAEGDLKPLVSLPWFPECCNYKPAPACLLANVKGSGLSTKYVLTNSERNIP